jgi:hypothetical protein
MRMDLQMEAEQWRHMRAEATLLRERFLRISQSYNEGLEQSHAEDTPRDELCADMPDELDS